MDLRAHLKKLRAMPEQKKKIVLWTIVVVIALPMLFFWVRGAINGLSNMPSLELLETVTPSNESINTK